MPTAIKRRKLSSAPRNASSSASQPRGIDAFTKVSKGSSIPKSIIDKVNHVDAIATTPLRKHSTTERKRKLDDSDEESAAEEASNFLSAAIRDRNIKRLTQRQANNLQHVPQTPQKPILNGQSPPSINTPTKGARSLLDRLFLSNKTPTRSSLSNESSILESTTNTSPPQPQDLPTELFDLINLHAAFLTALSIHYAHNGTHSPADLRNLCADVARAWGKRSVTLEDIRRTVGVLNSSIPEGDNDHRISQLSLSDYGHSKICIEMKIMVGKPGRIARPVNENLLNEIFVKGLKTSWEERDGMDTDVADFIAGLPLEPITICSSVLNMSPLLAKGQRRLEDLRAGIMIKKEEEKKKAQEAEITYKSGAKPSLLERLRAKRQLQSSLPPPPSKAEFARKAALQRIDEVAAVLTHLSTSSSVGQQRISFTLPALLGKLRDSFKTPMSKEEGETCVRLLASEIAPEWVQIVKMGKVDALVVNRDERLRESDLQERVKRAA
jgi:hypothetical protein